MPLISVEQDINSHGEGALIASQDIVLINNKYVIVVTDLSAPDAKCPSEQGEHCLPIANTGSSNVFVKHKAVHRNTDLRTCGAMTIVLGQSNVFANEGGSSTSSSVFSNVPPEPPVVVTTTQNVTYRNNIVNQQKYNTPDNVANGVDAHPELEDDPAIPAQSVTNPDCTTGGDMGQALDDVLAESDIGMWKETGNNPNIQALYNNVGFANVQGDQTAWCAAFAGSMLKKNCFKYNKSLAAGSYTNYGNPVAGGISNAQKGDIVIFNRTGGTGHVAFYYGPGPTPDTIYVVGGNQSNNVTKSLRHVSDIKSNGVQRPVSQ